MFQKLCAIWGLLYSQGKHWSRLLRTVPQKRIWPPSVLMLLVRETRESPPAACALWGWLGAFRVCPQQRRMESETCGKDWYQVLWTSDTSQTGFCVLLASTTQSFTQGAGQGFQALLDADGVGAAAGTHRPRWETGGLLGILLTFSFLFSRHTKLSLSSTVYNP